MKKGEIIAAYNVTKDLKLANASMEAITSLWRNNRKMRPIFEEFQKTVEEMRKSFQNEEFETKQKRLSELEAKKQEQLSENEKKEMNEIISFNKNIDKTYNEEIIEILEEKNDIKLDLINDKEIIKILQQNDKTMEDVSRIEIMIK